MRSTVTAVLVARSGGDWLDQTIASLGAQTRAPDRIIAVVTGGSEKVATQLAQAGIERIVTASGQLPFGEAVRRGVLAVPADHAATSRSGGATENTGATGTSGAALGEWLWLLSEDSAPEPRALELILSTVQRSPSVAVAGPKLVDWDHPERIIELGQSLTHGGERWLLRRQELDQQQYDHLQDVLGVGPVGMLVRRDVWSQLDGFDPALPVYDDGLDFSVRARLAGYRVIVAPASRVRFAQLGIAGPRVDRSRRVMRVAHRQARTSHLHRLISYAPAFAAFFMWLGLPIVAVVRVAWALIREQPGYMLGEFTAALRVFFRPGALLASRRRIRANQQSGWAAVRPLRVDPKSVRTARMIDREAILASQGRLTRELQFISTGGLAVFGASLVATLVLCWWAVTQTSLVGGGLAPLSPIGELWQNTRTIEGVPADPFAWVLAVLGSFTFWNPSHAVVLFTVAAIPLAALGGWIWGAQLTESPAGRALVGLGWALSPVLLGSLDAGRFPTLVLAVVLPWLLLAATRCRESWSWAGVTSLLAAVALACAPVLIPAALVLLVVGLFSSLRGITRVLATAIAPLVLFAPKLVATLTADPLNLLLDPGITTAFTPSSPWQLMLGFPEFGLEGWTEILDALGLGGAPATLLVGLLFLPIVVLAVLGLLTGKVHFTILHAVLGGLGLLTALASSKLLLLSDGAAPVALWTGSGLALYWIAVLGLAGVGTTVLRRAAPPIVAIGLVLALVAVGPVATRLATAQTGLASGETQMPALVQAAGAVNPGQRTLVLTATGDQAVRAQLVTGTGLRLDQVRTADRVSQSTDEDQWIAELVGDLASTGNDDALQASLTENGVGFVLLNLDGDTAERALLQAAFDQSVALASAGQTTHGLLWRVAGAEIETVDTQPADTRAWLSGTNFSGQAVWWVQVVVLLAMLLLALPTGEVTERPERRRKPGRLAVGAPGAPTEAEVAAEESASQAADSAVSESEPESATTAGSVSDPEPELEPAPDPLPGSDPDPRPEEQADGSTR
ncbi:glycosyltransferase [Leucobacter sp. W1153]|uniref:glycosyltransferase n=1 Tax=Leucobacter sp. W1153 TaxID=3439064 RepID=UPI003F33169C